MKTRRHITSTASAALIFCTALSFGCSTDSELGSDASVLTAAASGGDSTPGAARETLELPVAVSAAQLPPSNTCTCAIVGAAPPPVTACRKEAPTARPAEPWTALGFGGLLLIGLALGFRLGRRPTQVQQVAPAKPQPEPVSGAIVAKMSAELQVFRGGLDAMRSELSSFGELVRAERSSRSSEIKAAMSSLITENENLAARSAVIAAQDLVKKRTDVFRQGMQLSSRDDGTALGLVLQLFHELQSTDMPADRVAHFRQNLLQSKVALLQPVLPSPPNVIEGAASFATAWSALFRAESWLRDVDAYAANLTLLRNEPLELATSDLFSFTDELLRATDPAGTGKDFAGIHRRVFTLLGQILNYHDYVLVYPAPGTAYSPIEAEVAGADPRSGLPENAVVRVKQAGFRTTSGQIVRKARVLIAQ